MLGRPSRGARFVVRLALGGALLLGSAMSAPLLAPSSAAAAVDVPEPPGVTAGLMADNLQGDAVFRSGTCQTGRAGGQNVGEGFRLVLRGRCSQSQDTPSIAVSGKDITLADGDVALDFKVVAGADRAGVNLYVRSRDGKLLATYLNFQSGEVRLFKRDGTENTTVASRGALREVAAPTDWNRLALRVRGGEAWLLINDEPLLHAADVPHQEGGFGIGIVREGNPDDEDEVAVVFRDLTVSAVDGAP